MNKKEYHRIYYKKNKIKILKRSYSKNKQCKCGVLICNTSKQCQNCYGDIISKRQLDINNPNFKGGLPKCIECGKELKNYYAKRCKSCSNKGKNHPNYIDGKTLEIYYCTNCGKKLVDYKSKLCSKCWYKYMKGKNHPNWQGGLNELGYLNFTMELKEQIRKRDNFECQNCGMTEEEHLIVKGRVLDIHHIDYNKQNCQKSNLITACQVCNIRANFNRDYWYAYFTYIMEH